MAKVKAGFHTGCQTACNALAVEQRPTVFQGLTGLTMSTYSLWKKPQAPETAAEFSKM